jgi:2-polyprenyl-6-methoxyphenol hydroxylase-like FAD-dependent oxidoreductase
MKIIVMGCGRVGGQASLLLARLGHSVTVIDHDANALARLGTDFKGRVVRGLGFDRNVLLEAGIQTAEAFVLQVHLIMLILSQPGLPEIFSASLALWHVSTTRYGLRYTSAWV